MIFDEWRKQDLARLERENDLLWLALACCAFLIGGAFFVGTLVG